MEGQFPLYSHLKNEIPEDKPLNSTQRDELVEKIKELDDQGCSLVYALIRYFQIYEDKLNALETPYGMRKMKLGFRFCIEEIPPLLQQLIYRFVQVHLLAQKNGTREI